MALHNEENTFGSLFPSSGLGGNAQRDALTLLAPVCNGTVSNPV
jgi:hypothetical protein